MKNTLRIVLAFCLLSVTLFAAEEGRFFTYPTIHNDKIVFTYESDLWVVERQGRRRLAPDDFPRDRELRQVLARRQVARLHGDLRRRLGRLPHAGRGRRPRPPDLQPRRGPGHRLDARRDRDRLPVDVRERRRPRPQSLFGRASRAARPSACPSTGASSSASSPRSTSSSTAAAATRSTTGSATRAASTRTSGSTTPWPRPTRRSPTTSARTATRCGSAA